MVTLFFEEPLSAAPEESLKKNFKGAKTITIKGTKTVSKKVSKLKAKKKYYVRIRTFRTVNKVKYYSSWSKAKAIKTKKK